jgi:lipid II:glycine glycyltransferase (peptidoglycan interpeptide bridge formation enzyme)
MISIARLGAEWRDVWDTVVVSRGAGFMQSWAWSDLKELEGYRVVRLGVFEGDRLVGGALAYVFPTPAEAHLAVVPDGPVLDWDAPGAARLFEALVAAIESETGPERVAVLRVEPRLQTVPDALGALPRALVDLVPDETLLIELGPDDEMLARMKPKGRYNVRLAGRHGVDVTTSVDPADVHDFYPVLAETARVQGFTLEPKSFFVNLARALCPEAGRFAFARWKGMTLAAALTVRHGDTVTFLYGGRAPFFGNVMPSYALHWHVMREAARDGHRLYDLYGWVPPGLAGHPYDRFSRFKEKLGGRPVRRIGSRDVIFYDRLVDAALAAVGHAGERRAAAPEAS